MVPLPPFFLSPAPFLVCITINGQLRVFLPLVSFLASIPSIFTVMLFSESWFDWHSVVRRSPVASQGNGCATWPRRGAATSSRGCSSLLLPCVSSGAATGCPAAGPPSAFRPPRPGPLRRVLCCPWPDSSGTSREQHRQQRGHVSWGPVFYFPPLRACESCRWTTALPDVPLRPRHQARRRVGTLDVRRVDSSQ